MGRGLPPLPRLVAATLLAAATGLASTPASGADAPKAAARGPRMVLDRHEHDYGLARQQARLDATFTITNEGDAPLHPIARGECSCVHARLSRTEVPPGETATLTVTFETYRFVGAMQKALRVRSDDPAAADVPLQLKIDIADGVLLHPANFFFNMALVGSKPTSTIEAKWKVGVGTPFKLEKVEATGLQPALPGGPPVPTPTFDVAPFEAAPYKGYRVTMRFAEPPPVGHVSGTAVLHTTDEKTPKVSTLIGGAISGPVQVSLLRPSFGVVPEGKGGSLAVHVRPFDASIQLGKVAATTREGRVRATVTPDPTFHGEFNLKLELPADAPAGPVEDVVVLTTEVPGDERIELPVTATVTPKPGTSAGK